jgi:Uma2 family endonuclease
MSSLPILSYTAEEYLAQDRANDYKSEFVAGEIYAMAGASPRHVLIATNTTVELSNRLKNTPCQVYSADLRVQAVRDHAYHYPDVVVVCGKPEYRDEKRDTITNPVIIVEVLSPTTRNYDRGDKFASYRRLASLQEYILIDPDTVHVEHFVRKEGSWEFTETEDSQDNLLLPSFGIAIPLADIYAKVELLDEA